jgi:TonB-linked SusC/RagA family outer membrane protein
VQTSRSLRQALSQLEARYRITFGYSNNLIDNQTVSNENWLKQPTAEQAIRSLLEPFQLTFEKVGKNTFLIFSKPLLPASPTNQKSGRTDAGSAGSPSDSPSEGGFDRSAVFTVSGRVVNEAAEALPGVSVLLKGTSVGTATNAEGRYSLNLPDGNGTLIFSFISYTTEEVAVNGRTSIDLTMLPDIKALGEVVVVGYNTQKKANLTSAVSTIKGEVLENRPVTNALNALQGTATGVVVQRSTGQPGNEQYSIQIRGLSSVNGGRPLVWVDGAPGSLDNLNPNDIESITVLKDAAATAIYGARAAGGVIVVTTKQGKSGRITVDYSGLYGWQKPIRIPQRLNSWEEAEMANLSRANAGAQPAFRQEEIDWMRDPAINYVVNPSNPNEYLYYDNINQIPLTIREYTPSQNHNLSLRGGDEKSNFFVSLGYYGQNGIYKVGNDKSDRYNGRFNFRRQLSKTFSLDARLGYNQRQTNAPSAGSSGDYGILMALYTSRTNNAIFLPGTDGTRYAAGTSLNTSYPLLRDGGRQNYRSDELNAVITLQAAEVVHGLTLRAVYSPRMVFERNSTFNRTVMRYNLAGPASPLNSPNNLEKYRTTTQTNSLQFLADYDWRLGEKHSFHLLGAYSYENYRYDYLWSRVENLSSNDLTSINFGDARTRNLSDNIQTWGLLSYFGRLNYNLDERFLFEFNFRYDGSSKLAPSNRWKPFPSLSAGWRVSQEHWFAGLRNLVDEFKIRASWGRVGNSDGVIGNYDYVPLLQRGPDYPFNDQRALSFSQQVLASPQKSWETIQTTNAGLDLVLLAQRLSVSADYFVKRNRDMLVPLQLPATIGIQTSTYNLASLRTWGWEVSVGWKGKISPNVSYFVNGNVSDYKNEVTSYNGQKLVQQGLNRIVEGRPFNSIYGYIAEGYFQTADQVKEHAFQNNVTGAGDLRYRDLNNDGQINVGNSRDGDSGDLVYLGNTLPRYTYGFNFGMNLKGFDFSAFFQGVGQRNLLLPPQQTVAFYESWRMPWDINTDYWTPQNPDARFPRLFLNDRHNSQVSSHWLANGSYLRLKNLQIGYTLPQNLTRKVRLERARVFFTGQDLFEISRIWNKYYDPEVPSYEAPSASNGFNPIQYPYPFFRTYSMGLNLTF